ncbi:asparagine synthase (glutamine-hydrolyzing) [Flavobacterium sp.]|uniref:asparagine synthase (glutamine-hydrolyzing) n=1 Tax=Flavobacterium sp. TaxID=239 RepID=UPI00404861FE
MCGILFSKNIEADLFQKALNSQGHRGPDNTGFISFKDILLGHNRLAIIDLDSSANQPFTLFNFTIVYNGEIYNFNNLRKKFEDLNWEFRTSSDTEVLLIGYIIYGTSFFKQLIGMFSFIIYDSENNEIIVARDFYGVKPLYKYWKNDKLVFSSELKPISILVKEKIDEDAIKYYLRYGMFQVNKTPFNEISEVENNCFIRYSISNDIVILEKEKIFDEHFFDNKASLLENLSKATIDRTVSDVPIGLFLSSGIDSTVLAEMLKEQSIKSYTVSFNNSFDESYLASITASKLKLPHKVLSCNEKNNLYYVKHIDDFIDIPFADPSYIPFLQLCNTASEKIKVAITGDGGDELLLGYKRYKYIFIALFISKIPMILRNLISKFIKKQRVNNILLQKNFNEMCNRIMSFENEYFLNYFPNYGSNEIKTLEDYFFAEEINYLKNDILVKSDRASMKFGLELRSPFLDVRLFRFKKNRFFSILKNIFFQKKILKDYLKNRSFHHILNKPKRGFTVDLSKELVELKKDVIKYTDYALIAFPHLIDQNKFKSFRDDFYNGKNSDYRTIYKIYVLGKWLITNSY